MRVSELIDILGDQPSDAEVELAVISPVDDSAEDITVDRYFVDGVLPWRDGDGSDGDTDYGTDDHPGEESEWSIWMVGGEESDVNAFLDAIEQPDV